MLSFSAALIAGGKSTRMGCDKALLRISPSELLWQRQLRILEEMEPVEIFWSGYVRENVPPDLRIVVDATKNAGPLAGISACLDAMPTDLLAVLAIDLPEMNACFLKKLLARCTPKRGVVVKNGDYFEPLAAIYPKGLAPLAAKHLARGEFALQALMRAAVESGLVEIVPLAAKDIPLFKNVNTPSDL